MEDEAKTIENSLLIITRDYKLTRIYCPFTVMAIKDEQLLRAGQRYSVISLKTSDCKLLFVVREGVYPHSFFIILTNKK